MIKFLLPLSLLILTAALAYTSINSFFVYTNGVSSGIWLCMLIEAIKEYRDDLRRS